MSSSLSNVFNSASSSPSASPAKVFVFGGNGLLGVEMVSALTFPIYSKSFSKVTAVIREETLNSNDKKKSAIINRLRATGANLISGDTETASATEIAKWLTGYDIVISVIGFFSPGSSIEHKLLEAIQLAGISWYIPAIFGFDVYKMYSDATPFMAEKRVVIEAIKATKKINYFVFNNGLFLEYLINPNAEEESFAGINIGKNLIKAPYSFDVELSVTSVKDIAHLTAEALVHREESHIKNQILYVAAETVSYNQIHQILEKHFQKKFEKKIVTKEEANELVKLDKNYQDGSNRFRVAWGESVKESIAWPVENTFNNKYAPHIKLTTIKQRLEQLYPQQSH